MANLPDNSEPIKISYEYPDGRVFSVQGKELEKLLKNMERASGAFHLHRSSFGTFDPVDWTVDCPAHNTQP